MQIYYDWKFCDDMNSVKKKRALEKSVLTPELIDFHQER